MRKDSQQNCINKYLSCNVLMVVMKEHVCYSATASRPSALQYFHANRQCVDEGGDVSRDRVQGVCRLMERSTCVHPPLSATEVARFRVNPPSISGPIVAIACVQVQDGRQKSTTR